MRSIRVLLAAVMCVTAIATSGCGNTNGAEEYGDKLTAAGFEGVSVSRDEETSGKKKKKKLVAYDVDWVVDTDGDDGTCAVELEYPANSSGSLKGDHWHIDEVNGEGVSGWGDKSPNPSTVRSLLQEHGIDC